MSEFDGFGFAAGVVRGTRSFDVDTLGRLTGVTYKQVWTPGENEAVCRKDEGSYQRTLSQMAHLLGGYISPPAATGPAQRSWIDKIVRTSPAEEALDTAVQKVREEEERRLIEEEERRRRDSLVDCSHGFYGYYDGSNDYYEQGRVMGVIEGYGETVIGTRGFRCMKARIVALRVPKHVPDRLRNLVTRNYAEIPVFDSFKIMVAEFPPDSAGSGITPDTDPDFWTRTV